MADSTPRMTMRELLPLVTLTLSAFLLNTSEFVPIGLLTDIAGAFSLSESGAGAMISVYAWAVALLSLPLMLAASRVPPRSLIVSVLAVFCAGQVASALAPTFELLVASRLIVAAAHAIFWSVASPFAVRVAAPGRSALAMSLIVTGTSVAMIFGLPLGRALGLSVVLTMPESMSVERCAVLSAFGAKLELTPAAEGMAGAVARAREILAGNPDAVMLDQFSNPGNPLAHELTTGPEILAQLPEGKRLAAFVASFGTGGTVTGVARALRKKFPDVHVVAVEPASSPLVTQGRSGAHAIQGIGANFVPACLAVGEIDEFTAVTDEEAVETARRLASEFGLFSGISTGANVAAALKIAAKLPKECAVVTIQPDRGDKYLSVFAR